jgi:Helicase associated domain
MDKLLLPTAASFLTSSVLAIIIIIPTLLLSVSEAFVTTPTRFIRHRPGSPTATIIAASVSGEDVMIFPAAVNNMWLMSDAAAAAAATASNNNPVETNGVLLTFKNLLVEMDWFGLAVTLSLIVLLPMLVAAVQGSDAQDENPVFDDEGEGNDTGAGESSSGLSKGQSRTRRTSTSITTSSSSKGMDRRGILQTLAGGAASFVVSDLLLRGAGTALGAMAGYMNRVDNEARWTETFERLVKYQEKAKLAEPEFVDWVSTTKNAATNPELGAWVAAQRTIWKSRQIKRLGEIGFKASAATAATAAAKKSSGKIAMDAAAAMAAAAAAQKMTDTKAKDDAADSKKDYDVTTNEEAKIDIKAKDIFSRLQAYKAESLSMDDTSSIESDSGSAHADLVDEPVDDDMNDIKNETVSGDGEQQN